MELTPRTPEVDEGAEAAGPGAGRPRRRRWLPTLVLVLVAAAIGVFVYRGLSDATLYFRNVDEAVAERDELGTRRFRLQGSVVDEPTRTGDTVDFQVTYGGAVVDVHHVGDPPELFRPGVPVVLEGSWSEQGDAFDSDRIMVKHDEEYESQEQYDERQRQAEEGAEPAPGGAEAPAGRADAPDEGTG